ncbi:flavin-containing monooxygenase [Rubrobacter calidifluminis]|uniref:flavin-containing monooxygenase n=1 Tax=Rubrobacter calidifluminis TaxID=1392640 RepID=UPI00235E57C4|nr:NAD(P)/FAD-dependent oxidoreductase [Rubrobacter calidifluminis]
MQTVSHQDTADRRDSEGFEEVVDVAVAGTGFAGLGMAIRMKQEGLHDFVLLERADEVGGTWRDNTYPGAACDVPSHLYSFSFALNPEWSRKFSPQEEIQEYLRRCAREYGIMPHVRFESEILSADWDEELRRWEIETTRGRVFAKVFVSGMGALSDPSFPDVPGLEDFEGHYFHSSQWDHDYNLKGKRVAVVGTGASSIQFVPQIQPLVESLHVFQRTPPWIIPRRDRGFTRLEKWALKSVPGLQKLLRSGIYWGRESYVLGFSVDTRFMKAIELLARAHLHRQVPDPELRERLTPDYTIGCKRILLADDYYPALMQPNAEVLTEGLAKVEGSTVVGSGGSRREVDAIIFGTGFLIHDLPASHRIRGRGGTLLADVWREGTEAYNGTTITGFPNLFLLLGPNTGVGHTSQVYMIESQIEYVLSCLKMLERRGAETLEVREEVQRDYNDRLQRALRGTVWTSGGCRSWYLDERGRNYTLWPGFTWRFRRMTREADPADYVLEGRLSTSRRTRRPVAL